MKESGPEADLSQLLVLGLKIHYPAIYRALLARIQKPQQTDTVESLLAEYVEIQQANRETMATFDSWDQRYAEAIAKEAKP